MGDSGIINVLVVKNKRGRITMGNVLDDGYSKLYPTPFERFIKKWIIDNLEDCMADAGLFE